MLYAAVSPVTVPDLSHTQLILERTLLHPGLGADLITRAVAALWCKSQSSMPVASSDFRVSDASES